MSVKNLVESAPVVTPTAKPVRKPSLLEERIPNDVIIHALSYLSIKDVCRFSVADRFTLELGSDNELWKLLAVRLWVTPKMLSETSISAKKLTEITMADAVAFVDLFLPPFKRVYHPCIVPASNETMKTAGKEVLDAEEAKDSYRLKKALISFYNQGSTAPEESILGLCKTHARLVIERQGKYEGDFKNFQMLLKSGIHFDADMLLVGIAENGHINSVRLLLNTPGLDFDSGYEHDPQSSILWALRVARTEDIKKLIRAKFNIAVGAEILGPGLD